MYLRWPSCAPRLQPYVSQVGELRLAAERSFRLHLATHLLSLSPAEGGGIQRGEVGGIQQGEAGGIQQGEGGIQRGEGGSIQRGATPEAGSRGQRRSPERERGTPASDRCTLPRLRSSFVAPPLSP